jgi:predicted secreted protein
MTIALAIALYFMTWWLVLFAVLPFGVVTQDEAADVVPGTPGSAPTRFNWRKVFLVNTVVATLAFAVIWTALANNWLGTQPPLEDAPPALKIETPLPR